MARRLIFIRHGESTANVDGSLTCAIPGVPLTGRGRAQAAALAESWDGTPVDAMVSSPMLRATQTAEPLAARLGLPVRIDDRLPEFQIGELHGRTDPESARLVDQCFVRWQADDLSFAAPGGESGADVIARLRAALVDLLAANLASTVVVAHGTLLRTGLPRLVSGLTPAFTLANDLPNTGRIVVEETGGPVIDGLPALACRAYG